MEEAAAVETVAVEVAAPSKRAHWIQGASTVLSSRSSHPSSCCPSSNSALGPFHTATIAPVRVMQAIAHIPPGCSASHARSPPVAALPTLTLHSYTSFLHLPKLPCSFTVQFHLLQPASTFRLALLIFLIFASPWEPASPAAPPAMMTVASCRSRLSYRQQRLPNCGSSFCRQVARWAPTQLALARPCHNEQWSQNTSPCSCAKPGAV